MSTPDKILCPVDFSDTSKKAVGEALAYAKAFDAKVLFLHIVDARYTSMLVGYGLQVAPVQPPDLDKLARESLDEFLDGIDLGGVENERLTRVGLPGDEILDVAEEEKVGLIVMGTHGRTGVKRMLIGSQAEGVVRQAEVPVLTVRG